MGDAECCYICSTYWLVKETVPQDICKTSGRNGWFLEALIRIVLLYDMDAFYKGINVEFEISHFCTICLVFFRKLWKWLCSSMQHKSTCLFLGVSLTKYCSLILPLHYTTFPVPYCHDIKSRCHGNSSLQRWRLVCEKSLCFRLCWNRSIPKDSWANLNFRERKRDGERDETGA